MSNPNPKVSVLMSVYNGAQYLREAIDSILSQTFTDFEFIIVNDCSTDETGQILADYAKQDSRIVLLENEENIGLTRSLNKGLKIAKGDYIARQDADDVSLPDRLKKQFAYMDANSTIAFLSAGVQYINDKREKTWTYIPPEDPLILRWELLFRNPIRHSTVFWRRELIQQTIGDYDISFIYSQDHDLWVRIIEKFSICTLPLVLVNLRWHEQSITLTKLSTQDSLSTLVSQQQFQNYFPHQTISIDDAARLRLMPRAKHELQQQQYVDLDAESLQYTVYQYIQLWRRFRAQHQSVGTLQGLRTIQQDVEKDLFALLIRVKQQPLTLIGKKLVFVYCLTFPRHAYSWMRVFIQKKRQMMLTITQNQVRRVLTDKS